MTLTTIPRQPRQAPRREIRDTQREQVARGPISWAKTGQSVWLLLGKHDGELAAYGVFSSRIAALHALRETILGDEEAARIEWTGSDYNPHYFEGWDDLSQTEYTLYPVIIDSA